MTIDENTRNELEVSLEKMNSAATFFYHHAARTGCQHFIEFCGLQREYVNLCIDALEANLDFMQNEFQESIKSYRLQYMAEKLNAIFGPILAKSTPAQREEFIKILIS